MRKLYASLNASAMLAAMNYVPTMSAIQHQDDDPEQELARERAEAERICRMAAKDAREEHRAAILGKMRNVINNEIALRTQGYGKMGQFIALTGMKSSSFQLQYLVLLYNFGYRWDVRETLNGWAIALLPKTKQKLDCNWKHARTELLYELAANLCIHPVGKKELLWDILDRSGYELRTDAMNDGIIAFELWREVADGQPVWAGVDLAK